jgi:hypothetical protein
MADALTRFAFEAEVIHWRGPSPYFFVPLPAAEAQEIRRLSKALTYGWGMIPVEAAIVGVAFKTSLFRKADTYFLPLKDAVRKKAGVTAGDKVSVDMMLQAAAR